MSDNNKEATANRHCDFFKAQDTKWYMNYAPLVGGNYKASDTYGPFKSFKEAQDYMKLHLPNPGGWAKDATGKQLPPRRAPNGHPVKSPQALVTPMPEAKVAARWLSKVAGANVAAPASKFTVNMQIRSLTSLGDPANLEPSLKIEGLLRYKIGSGPGGFHILTLTFTLIPSTSGVWFIDDIEVRGLTGGVVHYAIEPLVEPLIDKIVNQARLEGIVK